MRRYTYRTLRSELFAEGYTERALVGIFDICKCLYAYIVYVYNNRLYLTRLYL